jgi:hypothetical protein
MTSPARWIASVCLVGGTLALASAARADGPLPAARGVPLPAGVSWDPWAHDACEDACGEPSVAVVIGAPTTAPRAVQRAARWRGRLSAGYPFLLHTDELGATAGPGGVVVVAGLFESRAAAASWMGARGGGLRIVAIRDPRAHGTTDIRHVVEIDRREARAYRASEVDAITSGRSAAALRSLRPLCTLPAGSAFVVRGWPSSQMWVEARCGREAAYVRVADTRFQTVVRRVDGETRISQVVLVECDMATIDTWRWNEDEGRWTVSGHDYFPHPLDGDAAASGGGCGGS